MASRDTTRGFGARRLATETKAAFKTTEFWVYVVLLISLLIAGNTIEGQEGGADYFAADKVWLYATILTVGYFLSRGLAKSGSRDPYWEEPDAGGDDGTPIGERVKAAAQALTDSDGNSDGEREHAGSGAGTQTRY